MAGRIVSPNGEDGKSEKQKPVTYLLLVVQALVVIFENGLAFRCAAVVFGICVGHVACEDFLPEGEAAPWACEVED
jgi:hypothetical protein